LVFFAGGVLDVGELYIDKQHGGADFGKEVCLFSFVTAR